jgi:hypothetical protein
MMYRLWQLHMPSAIACYLDRQRNSFWIQVWRTKTRIQIYRPSECRYELANFLVDQLMAEVAKLKRCPRLQSDNIAPALSKNKND